MKGHYISMEIKQEVLNKIKTDGITATEASRIYGINPKNIYRWLSQGIEGTNSQTIEINRLKRENTQLKTIIGKLMLSQERGKKG